MDHRFPVFSRLLIKVSTATNFITTVVPNGNIIALKCKPLSLN